MRKALEVFEHRSKNESSKANILIQETENGDLDYGGSLRDKWFDFKCILKIALWQDWLITEYRD